MISSELLKFAACVACAVASVLAHFWAARRRDEIQARRALIAGALTLKLVLFVAILGFDLPFANPVDPTLHYLPETRDLLDGRLPYRDFTSVYSPFFTLLLAPAVALWDSTASVSIVMIAAEALMLAVYLHDRPDSLRRWRAATLYALSPISLYWVGVGYHSGLIATGTIAALVLLRRGRDLGSGLAAAVTFLFTKLTAVVAWPALLLYGTRSGLARRAAGMALALVVFAALAAAGLDVLMPLKLELFRSSPGNLPNILIALFPDLQQSPIMRALPFALLAALWFPPAVIAMREGPDHDGDRRFDAAVSLIAYSWLVFMIASRKSYTFYGPSFLIFVIHAFLGDARRLPSHLVVLTFLGATTTIEIAVASEFLKNGREIFRYPSALLDGAIVAAYAWLAWAALRSQHARSAVVRPAKPVPLPIL